jgi:hypothetical protein
MPETNSTMGGKAGCSGTRKFPGKSPDKPRAYSTLIPCPLKGPDVYDMSEDIVQQKSKDRSISQYKKSQHTIPRTLKATPDSGKEVMETLKYTEARGVRLRGALPTEPEQAGL